MEKHPETENCVYEVGSHSCASLACHTPTKSAASSKIRLFLIEKAPSLPAFGGLLFWGDLKHGLHPSTGHRRVCPLYYLLQKEVKHVRRLNFTVNTDKYTVKGQVCCETSFLLSSEIKQRDKSEKSNSLKLFRKWLLGFLLSHRDDLARTVRIQENSVSPFGLKMAITNNWRVLIAYYPPWILHNILALFILQEEKHFLPGYITTEGKCEWPETKAGVCFVLFCFNETQRIIMGQDTNK